MMWSVRLGDRLSNGTDRLCIRNIPRSFRFTTQLVSIGILGEYIGRIYSEQVKGRPLYTLAEIGGCHENPKSKI